MPPVKSSIVYLALGSNVGDRAGWLEKGIVEISKNAGLVTKRSSVYQTAAWGKTDQPAFLNCVIELITERTPEELLAINHVIESAAGRQRTEKWGARTLDIDILLHDDLVIQTEDLVLPHPFLHLRRFTLKPLCEIAPELIHPALHKSIATLLEDCPDKLPVERINDK